MNRNELKAKVRARTQEVVELARELYNLPIEFADLDITFPVKGKSNLATAWWKRDRWGVTYGLTFKIEAIEQQLNDCLYDSIPHEVAHLVNFALPHTGKNHDAGWKSVCRALGGSGNRTAKGIDVVLTPAKFQNKYLYVASCGTEVPLSAKMHNQVQKGQTRTLRRTKGQITRTHYVRLITKHEQAQEIKQKQAALAERQGRVAAQAPVEERVPTQPPVRKAARASGGKVSKADLVKAFLATNTFDSPADAKAAIMRNFDMTKQGAQTYYYKYR